MNHRTISMFAGALLTASSQLALADVVVDRPIVRPVQASKVVAPAPVGSRDAVALARRDPEIAKMIVAARGGQTDQTGPASHNETAVQVLLSGQCGFAGCSSQTLVAFTFRSSGANTSTHSVLALVSCPPVQSQPCSVAPAEVRSSGGNGLPAR